MQLQSEVWVRAGIQAQVRVVVVEKQVQFRIHEVHMQTTWQVEQVQRTTWMHIAECQGWSVCMRVMQESMVV